MSQYWGASDRGGYLAYPKLSKMLRTASQPRLRARQFAKVDPAYGKNKGDRFYFDRISNVSKGGGKITELQKMPEDQITVGQGSLIVDEWGNSIPYTGKLEVLAEFNIENVLQKALRNDMAKTLDAATMDVFTATTVQATPTGTVGVPTTTFTETGTIATAATRDVQTFDVKEIADRMDSYYLTPKYDGDDYVCLCCVGFARAIKDDPDWEDAVKYGDPERLFTGEVGRYYGVRFVTETNRLTKGLGTGSYKGSALFFGEDPATEGIALPEEIRSKYPDDYGRGKGVGWLGLMGWSMTYSSATPGETKAIYLTST